MRKEPEKYDALFFYGQHTKCYTAQRHKNSILAYKICSDRYNEHIAGDVGTIFKLGGGAGAPS